MPALPAMTRSTWFRLVLCLIAGAVGALSMPPLMTPALLVSLSFYWALLTSFDKKWQIAASGFLFGFGYFLAGLWWVGNALLVGGNPYLWALPLAVSGLQALLALFPMMAALTSQAIAPGRSLASYCLFIASFAFWEWGRGHFFTGFPWNLFGMSWTYSLPVLQSLSLVGIYGLSLLTLFVASAPAFVYLGQASRKVRSCVALLALLVPFSLYSWGYMRLEAHQTEVNPDILLQLVTPNIPQSDKWDPNLFWQNYSKTVQAIDDPSSHDLKGKTRLIILPETAMHFAQMQDAKAVRELQQVLLSYPEQTYLLTGMLRKSEDKETGESAYHNSLVGYTASLDEKFSFDKFHLVPFGEYIPFQKYIPIGPVVAFSGFKSGDGPQTVRLDGAAPFSPLVCYEVIFPGAVTAPGSTRPEWMVNVTNDAWYGVSPGPHQHLGHAVYRAIEEGLPLARSTNTGISAVIDPVGRILTQSPLFETHVQTTPLPRPLNAATQYARSGDLPYFILLFLLCLPAVWDKRPRR